MKQSQLELSHPKSSVYLFVGSWSYAQGMVDNEKIKSPSERYPWGRDKDLLPLFRALANIPRTELANIPEARVYFEKTNGRGEFQLAIPCSEILGILVSLGIKARHIYYTGEDQKWHNVARQEHSPQVGALVPENAPIAISKWINRLECSQ